MGGLSAGNTDQKKETLADKKERESLSPSLSLPKHKRFPDPLRSPVLLFILLYSGASHFLRPHASRPALQVAPSFFARRESLSLKKISTARAPVLLLLFFSLIPSGPSVSSTMPAGDMERRCGFSSRTSFRLGLLQAFSKRFKRFDFAPGGHASDHDCHAWTRTRNPHA